LFESIEYYSESVVSAVVRNAIKKYEPRIRVEDVIFTDLGMDKQVPKGATSLTYWNYGTEGRYAIMITVVGVILNTNETVSIDVNMNRLR
jgi:phage baseplate assembly protein W